MLTFSRTRKVVNVSLIYFLLLSGLAACGGSGGAEEKVFHQVSVLVAGSAEGGSISPISSSVEQGKALRLNVTINKGYKLGQISGCGGALDGTQYITAAVTNDCNITAVFEPILLKIITLSGLGGTISPSESLISYGQQASFTLSASTGYVLDSVSGCNGSLNGQQFVTEPLTADCGVKAKFIPILFEIKASVSGGGGTATPSSQMVEYGLGTSVQLIPESGFFIGSIEGCPGELKDSTFVTTAIYANCQLNIVFEKQKFTVKSSWTGNGSVSPVSQIVEYGTKATFTASPAANTNIDNLTGCGASLGQVGSDFFIHTAQVMADCEVQVQFVEQLSIPVRFLVQGHKGDVLISADAVTGASGYNLYLSTEPGTTKVNYQTKADGQKLEGITLPYVLSGLDKTKKYYFVLTAVTESGSESAGSVELTSYPVFKKSGGLNDTGITKCFNTFRTSFCPEADFPLQDAEYGRDQLAAAGLLQKQGTGSAGFDFTKLDANGRPLFIQYKLADTTSGSETQGTLWSSVRDNVTGLVWLLNADDVGLSGSYSWFNPDPATNGGFAGLENGGNCEGSLCDTYHLVIKTNELALGGASDWRLPTHFELADINLRSGYGTPGGPVRRDRDFFFKQKWFLNGVLSSSTLASASEKVKMDLGVLNKTSSADVMLVREDIQ
jgi:large repetitive protein